MTNDLMTIRQMCEAFEVTPRTLRFYEAKELLFPRREGLKRLFTRRDRARLKLILRGKRFGFHLEEIRQLLDLYDVEGNEVLQISRASEMGRGRMLELKAERDRLDQAIAELGNHLNWADQQLAALDERTAAE